MEKDRSCRNSISSNTSIKLPVSNPHHAHTRQDSEDLKVGVPIGVSMSTSGGSVGSGFLEPKRLGLSRNATSSELLDVKPNAALIRKSSAPALAVSEITGKLIDIQLRDL